MLFMTWMYARTASVVARRSFSSTVSLGSGGDSRWIFTSLGQSHHPLQYSQSSGIVFALTGYYSRDIYCVRTRTRSVSRARTHGVQYDSFLDTESTRTSSTSRVSSLAMVRAARIGLKRANPPSKPKANYQRFRWKRGGRVRLGVGVTTLVYGAHGARH